MLPPIDYRVAGGQVSQAAGKRLQGKEKHYLHVASHSLGYQVTGPTGCRTKASGFHFSVEKNASD